MNFGMQKCSASSASFLQELRCRIIGNTPGLEIPHDTGHRAMIGHGHERGQGNPLATTLGHETRAQTVPGKVAVQPRKLGTTLNDLGQGLRALPPTGVWGRG